jgi:hypothetical protein
MAQDPNSETPKSNPLIELVVLSLMIAAVGLVAQAIGTVGGMIWFHFNPPAALPQPITACLSGLYVNQGMSRSSTTYEHGIFMLKDGSKIDLSIKKSSYVGLIGEEGNQVTVIYGHNAFQQAVVERVDLTTPRVKCK